MRTLPRALPLLTAIANSGTRWPACWPAKRTHCQRLLRAKLISLALWVTRETRHVLRNNLPLTDLIEVNRTIMQGLCPQPDEAS